MRNVLSKQDIYFLADESEPALQRNTLSTEISRIIPGFDSVAYPSWEILLTALNARISSNVTLAIDEFPYCVLNSPELPSVIQKIVDSGLRFNLIICGSAQRMMQGLVLDSYSPLYGRADEILNIRPLPPGWIADALKTNPVESIESYAVWGGVPRYWELASERPGLENALKTIVFDYEGVLHREPYRLMLDDLRSAAQPYSVLSLIAGGSNRLSEIAARLGKPAVHLSRTLDHLIELGFIERQCPFGESTKSTKRSLYKCIDPFLLFWYRFICPNLSLLERGLVDQVYKRAHSQFSHHTGQVWENLARDSTAFLHIGGIDWKLGQRWWGKTRDNELMEIDVVAESFDGKSILLGEAKWENQSATSEILFKLKKYRDNAPFNKNKNVVFAAWTKDKIPKARSECFFIDPATLLKTLR